MDEAYTYGIVMHLASGEVGLRKIPDPIRYGERWKRGISRQPLRYSKIPIGALAISEMKSLPHDTYQTPRQDHVILL